MRGLYAILDVAPLAARGIDPLDFARAVVPSGPVALQVRAKDVTAREYLALLRQVGPVCRAAHVPVVCNDRPDLATLGGADYVHLGQEDSAIALVRRLSPQLKIGLSTHTPEQLERALEAKPDYVAYGPVFATQSKKNPDPVVGLEGLREAANIVLAFASRQARTPLVAIGGIDLSRATSVGAIADAAAVIAELLAGGATDMGRRARELHRALGGSDPAAAE